MTDGSVVGIGYAGQNGHRFVDLTAVLSRKGSSGTVRSNRCVAISIACPRPAGRPS